jgi:hypothetical protein
MAKFIQESDLDFSYLHCSGDEDLHPFCCCPRCGHIMVFCSECDTLYSTHSNAIGNARVEANDDVLMVR